MKKRIKYLNFWKDFDEQDNFFSRILNPYVDEYRFRIYSVYPNPVLKFAKRIFNFIVRKTGLNPLCIKVTNKKFRDIKTITLWYTGENIRPPLSDKYDLTLSFDQDSYENKNIYAPLFLIELLDPFVESKKRLGIEFDPQTLVINREFSNPDKFVCAFINNPEPNRMRAIKSLERFGEVDIFGKAGKHSLESKSEIRGKYKFMLCFENDLYPGYVTEKLLDAYLCDSVPLYWGDLGKNSYINRNSFINAADFESIEEFSQFVSKLTLNRYKEIFTEPLLKYLPSLTLINEKLEQILISKKTL